MQFFKVNTILKVLFSALVPKKSILGETVKKLKGRQKQKETTDGIIFLPLAEPPLPGAKYVLT